MSCKGYCEIKYTATPKVLPLFNLANSSHSTLRVGDRIINSPLTPSKGRGDENWSWGEETPGMDTTTQASTPARRTLR
jgi:hypothetical protein